MKMFLDSPVNICKSYGGKSEQSVDCFLQNHNQIFDPEVESMEVRPLL